MPPNLVSQFEHLHHYVIERKSIDVPEGLSRPGGLVAAFRAVVSRARLLYVSLCYVELTNSSNCNHFFFTNLIVSLCFTRVFSASIFLSEWSQYVKDQVGIEGSLNWREMMQETKENRWKCITVLFAFFQGPFILSCNATCNLQLAWNSMRNQESTKMVQSRSFHFPYYFKRVASCIATKYERALSFVEHLRQISVHFLRKF